MVVGTNVFQCKTQVFWKYNGSMIVYLGWSNSQPLNHRKQLLMMMAKENGKIRHLPTIILARKDNLNNTADNIVD